MRLDFPYKNSLLFLLLFLTFLLKGGLVEETLIYNSPSTAKFLPRNEDQAFVLVSVRKKTEFLFAKQDSS